MIERLYRVLHIAEEGRNVILAALFACVLLCWMFPAQYLFFILVFIFFPFFFRDPVRNIANTPNAVTSPADGWITEIDIVTMPEIENQLFRRIRIFLSIFNVHVQRFPYSGKIEKIEHKKGKFLLAFLKNISCEKESNIIVIETNYGPVAVKQIAGVIARRIVCKASIGENIAKGDRMGIIMLGSRVELYIRPDIELIVKIGDRVIGGQTIIGIIK